MLSTLASRLRTTAAPVAARALSLGPETFGLGKTPYSDEMPLKSLADSLADAVAPEEALMALGKRAPEVLTARAERELYVPTLPVFCPIAKTAAHSETLKNILVVDTKKPGFAFAKPRFTWYDPRDSSWIPTGWFKDGLVGDMSYYFGDPQATSARLEASSALWRAAKEQLVEAQLAQASELALHDQAWLRAAYPPTTAARRRAQAVAQAQQLVDALKAELQALFESEESRDRAWTSVELQRQAPMLEMDTLLAQERGWWAPELLRQEAAATTSEEHDLSWMRPELQRQATALEAELLQECSSECQAAWTGGPKAPRLTGAGAWVIHHS